MGQQKKGSTVPHKSTGGHFRDAVPANLAFPTNFDITVDEIVVWLPNYMRSHDVIHRLSSNGVRASLAATIANKHRTVKAGGVPPNTTLHIFQDAMRDRGYVFAANGNGYYVEGTFYSNDGTTQPMTAAQAEDLKGECWEWTYKYHQIHGLQHEAPGPWAPNDLALTGRLQCEQTWPGCPANLVLDEVDFADLLIGVQKFPSLESGAGHNLTRIMQFIKTYPTTPDGEPWKFPIDVPILSDLVRPLPVQDKHKDSSVVARYKGNAAAVSHADEDINGLWSGMSMDDLLAAQFFRFRRAGRPHPHPSWLGPRLYHQPVPLANHEIVEAVSKRSLHEKPKLLHRPNPRPLASRQVYSHPPLTVHPASSNASGVNSGRNEKRRRQEPADSSAHKKVRLGQVGSSSSLSPAIPGGSFQGYLQPTMLPAPGNGLTFAQISQLGHPQNMDTTDQWTRTSITPVAHTLQSAVRHDTGATMVEIVDDEDSSGPSAADTLLQTCDNSDIPDHLLAGFEDWYKGGADIDLFDA